MSTSLTVLVMDTARKKSPLPTYILIGTLSVIAVLSGFNYFFKPFHQPEFVEKPVVQEVPSLVPENVELTKEQRVEQEFEQLNPDQKIAQLIAIPIDTTEFLASIAAQSAMEREYAQASEDISSSAYVGFLTGETPSQEDIEKVAAAPQELFIKEWGFVTLFGSKVSQAQATQVIAYIDEKNRSSLDQWIMVDHEGGTVQRLSGNGFTQLPSWLEQCSGDLQEAIPLWKNSAQELRQVGVDVVLAPVVDIAANNPVLKTRTCSGTASTVYEFSAGFITLFTENSILPVLKHFPGIGAATRDLHTSFQAVSADEESVALYHELLSVYPYSAVMTSHVGITNQDAQTPCSLSSECVGQLEKEYPHVLVITDALDMKATGVDNTTVYLEDVAVQAAYAGNNVLLFGAGVSQEELKIVHDRLLREFNDSYVFREKVNTSVKRIIDYKLAK